MLNIWPRQHPPKTSFSHSWEFAKNEHINDKGRDNYVDETVASCPELLEFRVFWTLPNSPPSPFARHTRPWWMAKFHTKAQILLISKFQILHTVKSYCSIFVSPYFTVNIQVYCETTGVCCFCTIVRNSIQILILLTDCVSTFSKPTDRVLHQRLY